MHTNRVTQRVILVPTSHANRRGKDASWAAWTGGVTHLRLQLGMGEGDHPVSGLPRWGIVSVAHPHVCVTSASSLNRFAKEIVLVSCFPSMLLSPIVLHVPVVSRVETLPVELTVTGADVIGQALALGAPSLGSPRPPLRGARAWARWRS